MGSPAALIYVDGSYRNERIGYGWVVLTPDGKTVLAEMAGPISLADSMGTRQVAGELFAVGHALQWCRQKGLTDVAVYYDYYGIEKWATGAWKAKLPLTQRYRDFVRGCGLQIQWYKVESHTGNKWNEYVDQLAKKGLEMAV